MTLPIFTSLRFTDPVTRLALKTTKAQPFASLATGSRPAKGPITAG